MEQKKPMPKVPKFEQPDQIQQAQNVNLKMEMENFLNEINAQSDKVVSVPVDKQAQIVKQQPVMKDLSSLNEKLTNILKKKEILNSTKNPTPVSVPVRTPPIQTQNLHQGNSKTLKSLTQSREEYDPARPNDYEECRISFQQQQQQQQQQQHYTRRDPPIETPSAIEIEIENEEQTSIKPTQTAEEKALKMMERQGFKLGQGLGKNSQGMTTPLIARKTNDTVGVIRPSNFDMSKVLPQDLVSTRQDQERVSNQIVSYEFEFNDYPSYVKLKICSQEFLDMIRELTNCNIQQKGVFIEPSNKMVVGQRKQFLHIEGENEFFVSLAYQEIKRVAEEARQQGRQ